MSGLRFRLLALATATAAWALVAVSVWLELSGWVVAFHVLVGLLFLATTVVTAVAAWRPPEPSATPGFVRLALTSVVVGLALHVAGAGAVWASLAALVVLIRPAQGTTATRMHGVPVPAH